MHLTHFVRVFAKMLESNDSPLQNEIDKMRERLDEIQEENINEHKH
jgi:nitrate reductase assembly molybdenum cofactor insertion protein NarJ